ncbi:porin family protein [Hymenobacter jejuensis]|uniref:outer membrane beta-barrel protein n=1 Tax=Hymenobacter jejuensis TaxID=2502781 RepID=UPI0013FCF967|nr:outer membrane beta-barrel protein [Hymenobacter jejuensis]
MIRRHLLPALLFVSLLVSYSASAQTSPERRKRYFSNSGRPYHRGPFRITLGGGVGLYNGDLGGPSYSFPGPAVSLGGLYLIRPQLAVGGEFSYFKLGSKDKATERNLAFTSKNGSAVGFLRYELFRDEGEYASPRSPISLIKPYVTAGGGFIFYDPKSYIGPKRADANTNFRSPERNDYPATAWVVPVGFGIAFRVSPKINITPEATYYFTSTDFLDDVSSKTEGYSKHKDGYGLLQVKLEYAPWH